MSNNSAIYRLATPGIRSLSPYDPGKPLEELEREYGVSDAIKLASNENPLGPSPKTLKAIEDQLSDIHRYPDGSGHNLKASIAEHHGVSSNQICLGNGSNDVLDMVARVFVEPGETGIISQHAFIVYYLSLVYTHAKIQVIDAVDYGHDVEQMAAMTDIDTKIIYIANPNNPTGTWSSAEELRHLLTSVPSSVIVVIDEAYAEYVVEPDYPDCIRWLSEFPNLIITRTFSKIYGLASLRVGYSISSSQVADLLNRARQPFNCNSIAMAAAIAALNDIEHCERSRKMNIGQMKYLTDQFEMLGMETIESVGNFVCVDLKKPTGEAYEFLLGDGVITRPVGGYGLPNHLRVSVGTPQENTRVIEGFRKLQNRNII